MGLLQPTRLATFDPRSNGITAARLGLALVVVASHSVGATGPGTEPLLDVTQGRASLGFLAVLCFFALSGFLLASSRQRLDPATFLWNRGLRIVPGYALALVVSAFVALPVAAAMHGATYDWGSASSWLVPRLLFLPGPGDGTINAAYGGVPVNSPLWSLLPEIECYIALALMPRRWLRPFLLGAVVLLALWLANPAPTGPAAPAMLAFALGAAAWEWRARVPVSPVACVVAALLGPAAMSMSWHLAGVALVAYAALGLIAIPVRIRTDVSYGAYVLAWPVQQVLIAAGVLALGVPALFIATVALVLPMSLVSWRMVEERALALRRSHPLAIPMPIVRSRQRRSLVFVDHAAPSPVPASR